MNSISDADEVLTDLGTVFPRALVEATESAREELARFRLAFPALAPRMFERDLANLIHSFLWSALEDRLDGASNVTMRASEPHREIGIEVPGGHGYVIRVKRHGPSDRIAGYATATAIEFWGGSQESFDGLERTSLAVGYRWLPDTREIGEAVISYREGKDNVIWARVVTASGAGVSSITYTPIEPTLPNVTFDLGDEDKRERTDEATGS